MKLSNQIIHALVVMGASTASSTASAPVTSLTASLSWSTWKNTLVDAGQSMFETGGDAAQTTAIRCTCCTPGAPRRWMVSKGNTTITKTVTVTSTSALPSSGHGSPDEEHISWMTGRNDISKNMSDIAANFETIVSALLRGGSTGDYHNTNSGINATTVDQTSVTTTRNLADVSRAAIDHPSGSIVFLNTKPANYIVTHHASATVFVWTAPTNTSSTDTNIQLRSLVDNINTWLPYVEALGIFAFLREIGKFVRTRIQERRARRICRKRVWTGTVARRDRL